VYGKDEKEIILHLIVEYNVRKLRQKPTNIKGQKRKKKGKCTLM